MKKIKNVFRSILIAFLSLLVFLCVYSFVMTDLLKKDYANIFGYTYFMVASGSMSGSMEVNDIIFVKLTKDVREDDIITYKNSDGDIITHRLINITGKNYVTKGDVNSVSDKAITRDQIIGKVKFVISPSFILKLLIILLALFILLSLINFETIIQKYILKEGPNGKLPDDIFLNPNNKYEEPSSGLTVTIAIDEIEKLDKVYEEEFSKNEIEVLDFDEYMESNKKKASTREKETIDIVVSILKCKNNVARAKMNKKWLTKYQYIYKLCQLLSINDTEKLKENISNPPFSEIYDYDLDKVGLTETVRNRIYEMPIQVFLRLLVYTILYNDDEMFDGIYKILKYKAMVDKNNYFLQINKLNTSASKQVRSLATFMENVSNRFDNKKIFELDKIERLIKIGDYK